MESATKLMSIWPTYVLAAFARAHVIRNPVHLYEDLPAEVSPARPRRQTANGECT